MNNKVWAIIFIVLGSLVAVTTGLCMFEYSRTREVDCEKIDKEDMLPKQCKEGE